jgi:hypothetical protein
MSAENIIRQIDKTLDVLYKVETMMRAEAEMNATKHLADVVRPVPLAASVSSLIGDLEAWRQRESSDESSEPRDAIGTLGKIARGEFTVKSE